MFLVIVMSGACVLANSEEASSVVKQPTEEVKAVSQESEGTQDQMVKADAEETETEETDSAE